MQSITTGSVLANDLRFHYLQQGEGPLALCLHGFPDSPWSYRYLLPALADAGFHAVAPFIRGYAPTEIPADGAYDIKTLGADINALHAALGGDGNAVLIAYDWNATASYAALSVNPERWRRAVIGNIPPFPILGEIALSYPQIKRSFYYWFFQMAISEGIVAANDLAFIDGLWADWSPGYDATYDLEKVKECLRHPDNLHAALGYYTTFFDPASFGHPDTASKLMETLGNPVPHPVLYIHGSTDGCVALDDGLFRQIPDFLGPNSELAWIENVGHFFIVEKPQLVNELILNFLAK
jgi:pimeloyl-ACP methyl ester carboxylesterase